MGSNTENHVTLSVGRETRQLLDAIHWKTGISKTELVRRMIHEKAKAEGLA